MKYFKEILLVILIPVFALSVAGCSSNNPVIPTYNPTMICQITGDLMVSYSSYAEISDNTSLGVKFVSIGGDVTIEGSECNLVVNLCFTDKIEKTGKLLFKRTVDNTNGDYALGVFTFGTSPKIKTFYSDSGYVQIDSLNGTIVKGTFHFYATDSTSSHIEISNGTLSLGLAN